MNHIPKIKIFLVDHNLQNYDTAGDYFETKGSCDEEEWSMKVTKLPDARMEACIILHEFVEMVLTKVHNVSWKDIDEFDKNGEGKDHPDPGTLPSAPYYNEHALATQLEKKFAKMLSLDWDEYNAALDALSYKE